MPSTYLKSDGFLPPEVARALAQPDRKLGRFTLKDELGRGGMAAVFRALDPVLGRDVALKILRHDALPGMYQALLREAILMTPLQHPNIVGVQEFESIGATHYLEVDFVDGRSLSDLRESLSLDEKVRIIGKVARVVHFVHGQGLLHRDLKPSNILVTSSGDPMVNDFGLAYPVDSDEDSPGRRVAGTPYYMAPEQVARQEGDLTPRTDVYALGVILYELLTGRVPFEGDTAGEVYDRLLRDEPVPIRRLAPEVPEEVAAACAKAMSRDPLWRFATAGEFAEALATSRRT